MYLSTDLFLPEPSSFSTFIPHSNKCELSILWGARSINAPFPAPLPSQTSNLSLKTSLLKSCMTVPPPVTVGENGFEGLKHTPASALLSFYLFHLPVPSSLSLRCNEVDRGDSFPHTPFFCLRAFIWSSSLPPLASPSVLYLCPVMRLTANLSSSLILSPSSSPPSPPPPLYFYPMSSPSPVCRLTPHFLPSATVWPVMRLTTKPSR